MKLNYWLKLLIMVVVFVLLGFLWSVNAFLGWFIGLGLLFGFPLFRLYQNRDAFLSGVNHLESIMFGKPLSRRFWDKNELKNTKIKINWRKKKVNKE